MSREERAVYRVFEALDQVVTIVEEARGLPMTSNCVVPRGDVLELLDDVRDAIPAELDDAQDVLDRRDEVVGTAQQEAEQQLSEARTDAERTIADAQQEAQRLLDEAGERAETMVADAQVEAERTVALGRQEYEQLTGRAEAEAERMTEGGWAAYERSVAEGRAEQARLVDDTEVVAAARAESARIVDEANDEADRLRSDCDAYIDRTLGEFEDLLTRTLRTVGRGRDHIGPVTAGDRM